MNAKISTQETGKHGFTLLETVVNIGLLLVVMVVIASIAGHTSETVHSTSGKLAAAEKAGTVRQALKRDLAAVVRLDAADSELECEGSEISWKLDLRVPGGGGWQQISYEWEKSTDSLAR